MTIRTELRPTAPERPRHASPRSWASPWRRIGIGLLFSVAVLGCSVITVLRYTAPYLNGDTVLQSVMSIQDVDLFSWGQNRFVPVVSALASPVADPSLNLWLCLLINSIGFHLLLFTLSCMGARVVTGGREWLGCLGLFLVLTAVSHALLTPDTLYVVSLEAQPHTMSYLLTLFAFMLWRRNEWWSFSVAILFVGVAAGLNPASVFLAALLAMIAFVRRRQWIRWPLLGVIWVSWFAIWVKLQGWYLSRIRAPVPDPPQDYLNFGFNTFVAGYVDSAASIFGGFRPIRFAGLVTLAAVAMLLIPVVRRVALWPRLTFALLFCVAYWMLFTGNPWVSANDYFLRYFFPVVVVVLLCVATPIASALFTIALPRMQFSRPSAAIGGGTVACVAALWGPITLPSDSQDFLRTQAAADFARANDVTFVSGNYWDTWPIQHQLLDAGRDLVYVTAYKSGGDPAAYQRALDRELSESDGRPKAICVNEETSECRLYLQYWTRPGWRDVAGQCPAPLLGSPPVRDCRILEFTGQ